MNGRLVALGASLLSLVAFGAVPDLTDSLELLGNPTLERWTSSIQANSVMDLQVYRGKIYIGTGDWDKNKGPVPIWAYDPESEAFTNELTAGTDAIEFFRVCSDGRLYAPATDPHESAANVGSLFRRELDGSWTIFPNYSKSVLPSSSGTAQLVQHVFDVEICKSRLFMIGNGIAMSADDGKKWARVDDNNAGYGPRMSSLIRLGDEIFCEVESSVYFSGSSDDSGTLEYSKWFPSAGRAVMWRWNESTGVFGIYTNTWANIAPGLKHKDATLQLGTGSSIQNASVRFWHATPFGNRNMYVIGDYNSKRTYTSPVSATGNVPSGTRPMMAASGYAADDGNGGRTLKADRIALPDGYWPIDFCVSGDTAYMLAFAYNSADQNVRHGVWKSTDGVNFTQVLSLDYQQVMMSLEHLDGYFYLGVAHTNAMVALGKLKSGTTENAGSIYRVRDPQLVDAVTIPYDATNRVATAQTMSVNCFSGMSNVTVSLSEAIAIPFSTTNRLKVLEITGGTVDVSKFVDGSSKTCALPTTWFESETDAATGHQIVYLVAKPVIEAGTSSVSRFGVESWTQIGAKFYSWSDQKKDHSGADYYLAKGMGRTGGGSNIDELTFGGDSLTIDNGKQIQDYAGVFTLNDFRVYGTSVVSMVSAANGTVLSSGVREREVRGNVHLAEGATCGVQRSNTTNLVTWAATLTGTGTLKFSGCNGSLDGNVTSFKLYDVSPDFAGNIMVYSASADKSIKMGFTNSLAFGGSPLTVTPDAVKLSASSANRNTIVMIAENDVEVTDPHRGWTVTYSTFRTPSNVTWKMSSPLVVTKQLVKDGAGTLALGTTLTGSGKSFPIVEGYVQPLVATCCDNMNVVVSDGAGLRVAVGTGDDVTAYGLRAKSLLPEIEGGKIAVRIDAAESFTDQTAEVAICTVPSSQADLTDKFSVIPPRGYLFRRVIKTELSGSDAEYVRYAAEIERIRGAVILMR